MVYTLGEAAKATGKSKATISKSIKSGKISASKNEYGVFQIDPSELHRVYPPVAISTATINTSETVVNTDEASRIRELELLLKAAEDRIRDKEDVIADIREERDNWRQQATALLSDARQNERPKGFLRRIFGQ